MLKPIAQIRTCRVTLRIDPLSVWPYGAGPKAGEAGPEDSPKPGVLRVPFSSRKEGGFYLGPASPVLGPALWGYTARGFYTGRGNPF